MPKSKKKGALKITKVQAPHHINPHAGNDGSLTLTDENGETHDYTREQNIEYSPKVGDYLIGDEVIKRTVYEGSVKPEEPKKVTEDEARKET